MNSLDFNVWKRYVRCFNIRFTIVIQYVHSINDALIIGSTKNGLVIELSTDNYAWWDGYDDDDGDGDDGDSNDDDDDVVDNDDDDDAVVDNDDDNNNDDHDDGYSDHCDNIIIIIIMIGIERSGMDLYFIERNDHSNKDNDDADGSTRKGKHLQLL